MGQNVPSFDGNRAMNLLQTQCEFGPRFPESEGHLEMKNFLVNFLHGKEMLAWNSSISMQVIAVFSQMSKTISFKAIWYTPPDASKSWNQSVKRLLGKLSVAL